MVNTIDAVTLKAWLSDGDEIAVLDVREHGQFGEGHLFFAIPAAYSALELKLTSLVPNRHARLILCDDGDGVAERAARRAVVIGYSNLHILAGGVAAWQSAGNTLYSGVNVPSKTFGELVEIERQTPHLSAEELQAMIDAGANMVIVDGRPFNEFQRVSIPGAICCPNGELALRIDDIAPDPQTTIVVNCAGRTRSIVGAQTLIDLAVPNQVVALENGTQGWSLAGLKVETGASLRYAAKAERGDADNRRARARILAQSRGVGFVEANEISAWLKDDARTTYLFDTRTHEEYRATGSKHFVHAPGGQLIQATDQWVGVRGSRLVLADSEMIRAPIVAAWLRQLGYDTHVLVGGVDAVAEVEFVAPLAASRPGPLPTIEPAELLALMDDAAVQIIDLRASAAYREAHISGAIWSIRPRIAEHIRDTALPVVLIADRPAIAELATTDLGEAGVEDIRLLNGDTDQWRSASLPLAATPDTPPDAECIDFLYFTHRRLVGDAEHSRQYLAWEVALIGQLDESERAPFKIIPSPGL